MLINTKKIYSIIPKQPIHADINNVDSLEMNFKIYPHNQQNIYLIHRALRWQLHQHRYGNAHTKTQDEVRGGGKKPWKQKGTGRARAGSSRSPLWKGGGVIFGPRSKVYKSKINKKEKNLAIQNIIYNKFANTFVINHIFYNLEKPNTKLFLKSLTNLKIPINNHKILLIVKHKTRNLYLSVRNIPNIEIIQANQLNLLALLKADKIIITIDGFNIIHNIYNQSS